ncbi:hypothetical protein ACFOZY_11690 [Chungangia koreensis]|uniref:Sporulation protein YqfC n=1 Tax=Chungangia koreensis TaxID=752657 RepID=A0ABV8XAB8_9LACT
MFMKDLLQMDPQVVIENFEDIKLSGSYRIVRFEKTSCSFRMNGFYIEVEGDELQIDILQEQLTYLRIKGLKSITIKEGGEA